MLNMHSGTLQGLFDEQKPVHRKNFIKENMRYIKEMQGLAQNTMHAQVCKDDKYRNVPPLMNSQFSAPMSQGSKSGPIKPTTVASPVYRFRRSSNKSLNKKQQSKYERNKLNINQLRNLEVKTASSFVTSPVTDEKRTDRCIQTERQEDLKHLYENGVIKYPSMNILKEIKNKKRQQQMKKNNDRGDTPSKEIREEEKINSLVQNLSIEEEKDYIKENVMAIKQKQARNDAGKDPTRAPRTYQKGVLPKYLKERRDEQLKDYDKDPECPPGHVLLPDEERKETLRVLRQSYADRIQELNAMPVRNDTLRMRKRKMEIEEELKKIDEGIKVFQRPKVFVKINA